ncbi:MAG: DUF4900 domain-containing protein [Candidatus Omnitrophica bacterium]|nr:DUF4900 domain-containing protein [Candidatus Omnitrophota bacterium]
MNNNRGVALALALMSMMLITTLSAAFVMTAVREKNMADISVRSAKAMYAAEAGANAGLLGLSNLINVFMLNTVNATNPSVVAANATTYANTNNGLGLLMTYVRNNGAALLSQVGSEAQYIGANAVTDNGITWYVLKIKQKSNPSSPTPNVWDFPYLYKIEAVGVNGSQLRVVRLNGDFTVRVQKDNFARYALFTNSQNMPDGTNVWFTGSARFAGPLFTNGQYNFAYNPSGTFTDTVKQSALQARFYNNGSALLADADANGSRDVPSFAAGFSRGVTAIAMPTTSDETSVANEAAGGMTYSSTGIYVPLTGSTLKGGVYVYGDAAVNLSLDASNRQVITITQTGGSKTITLDRSTNQTLVNASGVTTAYSGLPDGLNNGGTLVYVRGNVTALSGTVQGDNQMTISTRNDIVINNNLRYEHYTPASGVLGNASYVPPSAEGFDNLLGLVSWQGNARIASTAPNNMDVHATVMAKQGIFTVDNYNSGSPKGVATVLGGVITNNYGAFGTFTSSTGAISTGYSRNFNYDTRMQAAMSPPYFPTMNTFIAFTDDIADKLTWQQGGF